MSKPVRVIDLLSPPFPAMVRDWLAEMQAATINVAGPRESSQPGIYTVAKGYLLRLFASEKTQ